MYLADFGFAYPEQLYIVQSSSLEKKRAALVAAMAGERKGWADVFADPSIGIRLTMDKYGVNVGLDEKQQTLGLQKLIPLMQDDTTMSKGLFSMSDDAIASAVESLKRLKLDVDASLFTNEILDEI
jgi:hypothetical protein